MNNKLRKVAAMVLMVLFAVAMCSCQNKESDDANMPQITRESACDTIVCSDDGIVTRNTNKDGKDFEFMYGEDTAYPWSCYVTEDSLHVLKLERVHSDSFGASFRALIFEPMYWCKGTYCFPELGEEPTFVGYGTVYYPTPDHIDFSFIEGYTDSDETYFVLSGQRPNWDSILIGSLCPPVYSSENIETCVFKKQSWDEISSWWHSKQGQ